MTIAEILQLPGGTKVEPFHGTIKYVNPRKSAKAPQVIKVTDGVSIVAVKLWKRPDVYDSMQGKPVLVAGGVVQDNTYNGATTKEVHLHPEGSFDTEGAGSQDQKPSAPAPADAPIPAKVNGHAHPGNGKRASEFFQGFIHDAVQVYIKAYEKGDVESAEFFGTKEFSNGVYRLASDLVRVAKLIEEGKLAPSAKEREELVGAKDKVVHAAEELFVGTTHNMDDEEEGPLV